MKKRFVSTLSILVVLTVGGCATQTGWAPTVDAYGDPNPDRISADLAECKQLAMQASGGTGSEALTGAAIGGLLGAATGAAIGAATGGNPASGAAIGAAAGGLGYGTHKGMSSEDSYKIAYSNCLRNRGHRVLN
jgi:uncharacterized protein YcfJ